MVEREGQESVLGTQDSTMVWSWQLKSLKHANTPESLSFWSHEPRSPGALGVATRVSGSWLAVRHCYRAGHIVFVLYRCSVVVGSSMPWRTCARRCHAFHAGERLRHANAVSGVSYPASRAVQGGVRPPRAEWKRRCQDDIAIMPTRDCDWSRGAVPRRVGSLGAAG